MQFTDPCFSSRFDESLAETRSRARSVSRPVLHRTTLPIEAPEDLLTLLARARQSQQTCFFWELPAQQVALIGIGSEWNVTASGPHRFDSVLDACRRIAQDTVTDAQFAPDGLPLFLSGFAFSDNSPASGLWGSFPPAHVFVPRILVARHGRTATLTVSTLVRPGNDAGQAGRAAEDVARFLHGGAVVQDRDAASDAASTRYEAVAAPTPDAWKEVVAETVAEIRSGCFEKVVLARTCRITSNGTFDATRVLQRLRQRYPTCATFCFALADAAFVGATPERLLRLQNGVVETAAIAGSIARGGSLAEDRMLARALVESSKDRGEQAVVVRALVDALEPLCESVEVAPEPEILSLENVHHLRSTIRGRLRGERHILDLVQLVHPTPAVGGFPRAAALVAMRKRETEPRGWYAGPLGWIDQNGDGEFWVAIRSALLHRNEAALYAGAGIVADSVPEAELAETRLKLQPMLSALMEL